MRKHAAAKRRWWTPKMVVFRVPAYAAEQEWTLEMVGFHVPAVAREPADENERSRELTPLLPCSSAPLQPDDPKGSSEPAE